MSFEDTIRQIIREEVSKAINDLKSEMLLTKNGLPPVLKVDEAAELLKVGKATIYEWCHDPTFPAYKDGRKIRIPTQALLNWFEARKQSA